MKNTNLLISYLLVGILLVNFSQAVPYKAPKLIDELKIPYCLDQVGYKCNICGYNDELQKFTAPNALDTACLPTETGCKKFADLQGKVCAEGQNNFCSCGFVKNHLDKCVVAPVGLENCLELNFAGDQCKTCPTPDAGLGGHGDFGRSFDDTKCIDNVVNQVPNCDRFKNGDVECAYCRSGFLLNASGKCIQTSLTGGNYDNCELVNDLGACVRCKIYSQFSGSNCIWDPARENHQTQGNCAKYQKLANGVQDNISNCIQCNVGYIITKIGCVQIGSNGVNLKTGAISADIRKWCLGAVDTFDSKHLCSIPLTQVADYNQVLNAAAATTTVSTAGSDASGSCKTDKVNNVDLTCPSVDDCDNGSSALVYQKNSQRCLKFSSYTNNIPLKYCQVADGKGWCETCHDGYILNAANGRCEAIKIEGCKTVNADGISCDQCFSNLLTVDSAGTMIKRLYYKQNPLTLKCNTPIDIDTLNCKTVDADGLCTVCKDNFALEEGKCVNSIKPDTPIASYGCETYDGSQCSKPLLGFECDTLGIYCWALDNNPVTSHNCQKFASDGTCELCNKFNQVKVFDPVTKKYTKCANGLSAPASYCEQFSESCNNQCIECKPTYTKNTLVTSSYQCHRASGLDPLPGCVKHSSETACEVCEIGYLKTGANTCFNLYGRRIASPLPPGTQGVIFSASATPEACLVAANEFECTTCLTAPGISTLSVAGTEFSDSKARKYCLYNSQTNARIKLSTTDKVLNLGPGCTEYEVVAGPAFVCKTIESGSSSQVATVNGKKALYDKKTSNGIEFRTATNDVYNCKAGKFDASLPGCTECNYSNVLETTEKKCISLPFDCRVGQITTGTTTECTTCDPGFQLSVNAASGDQCHSIQGISTLKGEAYCGDNFNLVNADISASYDAVSTNWVLEVTSCGKGFEIQNKRCVAKLEIIPKCQEINADTGNCKRCAAGYRTWVEGSSTFVDNPARDQIFITHCKPEVINCASYNTDFTKCLTCKKDPVTNEDLLPDDSGSVCLKPSVQFSTGCAQFALNNDKPESCLKCKDPMASLTDGCAQKDPFCNNWGWIGNIRYCTSCVSTHQLNFQRKCVENTLNLLRNCDVAFNSTACLNCDSNSVLVVNSDNEESDNIGICHPMQSPDDGCLIFNEKRDNCLRCKSGWAELNGLCVENDAGLLWNCAEYKYNSDTKRLYCSECDFGYAIDGNYTTCIANNNKCSDITGGNDCAQVVELKAYGQPLECDTYRSSTILMAFGLILSFSLLLIL